MLSEVDNNNMEGTEEHVVGSCKKGKRTKRRLRPLSPPAAAAVTSSCSSASFSSTTFEGTNHEEEDMAHCLILLAQGKREEQQQQNSHRDDDDHHRHHSTKSGFYMYECKTCNRTFPSFQALGGHRASHKKPKTQQEKKSSPLISDSEEANFEQFIISSTNHVISLELGCGGISNTIKSSSKKIHECSICGSEFTSGQALGGHMRRHRTSNNNNVVGVNIKPRNVLQFDLNLPAPPEDDDFQFPVTTQTSVVLSAAPPLVGCHY